MAFLRAMTKPRGPRNPKLWPIGRVAPDDPQENTRDHERIWMELGKIRALPRGGDDAAPASGIQFDTDPQSGGYLLVDTTGTLPSGIGSGYGIVFRPSDGFLVYTTSSIFMEGDAGLSLTSPSGNIGITAGGSGKRIELTADDVRFMTGGGEMRFSPGGASDISLTSYIGPIKFTLASTKPFTVYKSDGVTKHFEVRDDGTVHIKTAGAVIADL